MKQYVKVSWVSPQIPWSEMALLMWSSPPTPSVTSLTIYAPVCGSFTWAITWLASWSLSRASLVYVYYRGKLLTASQLPLSATSQIRSLASTANVTHGSTLEVCLSHHLSYASSSALSSLTLKMARMPGTSFGRPSSTSAGPPYKLHTWPSLIHSAMHS